MVKVRQNAVQNVVKIINHLLNNLFLKIFHNQTWLNLTFIYNQIKINYIENDQNEER